MVCRLFICSPSGLQEPHRWQQDLWTRLPINKSAKQKLNTCSSTEGELVAANDMATMILWTKLFMEAQGYEIRKNILFQDNKSTILLENNGKRSSSQRMRAFNIRYFFSPTRLNKET